MKFFSRTEILYRILLLITILLGIALVFTVPNCDIPLNGVSDTASFLIAAGIIIFIVLIIILVILKVIIKDAKEDLKAIMDYAEKK